MFPAKSVATEAPCSEVKGPLLYWMVSSSVPVAASYFNKRTFAYMPDPGVFPVT
jgi:hypothetical protein